ncbi:hypothetical protein BH23CHL2_BH23CHL2_24930 [soil metagenome]
MLKARLDKKTGLRVFCGRKRCRGEFGHITIIRGSRVFRWGAGWRQCEDGVYEATKHVRDRIERGFSPRNRGAYRDSQAPKGRLHTTLGHDPAFDHGAVDLPAQLPVVARCPLSDCGQLNEITAEALDVIQFDLTAPGN